MTNKWSGSCIKVHGVPLLPPIITSEMRIYIKSMKMKAVEIEKKLSEKCIKKLYVNKWTEVSSESGLLECGQDPSLVVLKGASSITVSSSSSSTQTDLNKRQELELITLHYPVKKEKITKKWNKSRYSSSTIGKWTSCPSHLGTSSTILNETVSIGSEELSVTESYSDEWKRWMSLPDVYDMTSSVTSEYTQNVNMTNRMAKLEISPDRQKSYTLVRPSKYLVDYVKKKAYEYCNTSHLCHRNKSYTVIEPSKFLLDYVRKKGYVGPVEKYVPEQSSSGSSKISSNESQWFMSSSFPPAPIMCKKCRSENCLCGEELPASYQTQELKTRAATKINAAVRGYLVRRLMKTRHVQQCLDTMRYTLQCHIALSSKPKDDRDNVELHLHIMRQLLDSCEEFYNIFIGSTRSEQLKIIANDRLLLSE